MKLFGEKVESSNIFRVLLIFGLGIIWIMIREIPREELISKFFLNLAGFFLISILIGELTRKTVRFFWKGKEFNKAMHWKLKRNLTEQKKDNEALNFGLAWSVVIVVVTIMI